MRIFVSVGVWVAQELFLFVLDERALSGILGYPVKQGLTELERQRPERQRSEPWMVSSRSESGAQPQRGSRQRVVIAAEQKNPVSPSGSQQGRWADPT
jgi:hypothetical protein